MTDPAAAALLTMLLQANRLKTTPRTGWAMRGVPRPESVADHSHGTALVALVLLDLVKENLDRQRVLAMAVTHDLAESVTGDLSLGASRLLPPGAKARAEAAALGELLSGLPFADRWGTWWDDLEAKQSPEALLVRDADRLDLLIQALVYERTTGNRELGEFWEFAPEDSFHYEASRAIRRLLAAERG